MMSKWLPAIVAIVTFAGTEAYSQEVNEAPAIRIRWTHPDRQLQEVLNLFQGTRAEHPAAALTAWKRASPNPNRLGKPTEALIAALNPRMVGELRQLEGLETIIRLDPETGRPDWFTVLPADDGTFAALASAFVLSGGTAEAPLDSVAVDRLAGPGSPLMARAPVGTILAGNREAMKAALSRPKAITDPNAGAIDADSGLRLELDPAALEKSNSVWIRRFAELIRPVKPRPRPELGVTQGEFLLEHNRFLDRDLLSASLSCYDLLSQLPSLSVNLSWFDWVPNDRVIGAFSVATDPAAESWKSVFALADRIEKVDPTMANAAPLQLRLSLLTRALGIRLETDLLHHLQGVSGWVGTDGLNINSGAIVLHLDDQDAAERIVRSVKPIPGAPPGPANELGGLRWLGNVEGKPVRIGRLERTVILGWGEGSIEASLRAHQDPKTSVGPSVREWHEAKGLFSYGFFWPERVPGMARMDAPRIVNVDQFHPVEFQIVPSDHVLSVRWYGIKDFLQQFLDHLPLDPPPDR